MDALPPPNPIDSSSSLSSKGSSDSLGHQTSSSDFASSLRSAHDLAMRRIGMVLDISAHVRNRAFSASASSYPLNVGPSQSLFTRASKFRDFCNTTQLAIKINHLDEGRITLVEGYIDDLIEEDWSYLDNKPKLQKEVFTALSDVRNTFRTTTDRNARLKMLDKLDNLLERACPEPESPSSSSSLEGRKVFVVVERNGEYFDETGKNITW